MPKKTRRRQRRNTRVINLKTILIVVIGLIILLSLTLLIKSIITRREKNNEKELAEEIDLSSEKISQEINEAIDEYLKPEDETINLMVVGGIFCQEEIYKNAYNEEAEEYNFYSNFHKLADKLSSADLTIGLLETNFVDKPYSGKGIHNAPTQLAGTLKIIGIDILNTATNYSFDYGIEGIISTKNILEENKIEVIGTYRTEEEASKILIKEVQGIKIAFLSYTYGTNKEVDDSYKYSVNIINKEKMKQDIDKAKENNADFIFVNMHWGDLNSQVQNKEQEELMNYLFENGADIIIGGHPSQIQPMEMKKNSNSEDAFVAYSMGNFISTEDANIGLMINIKITKSATTNEKYISQIIYMPTYIYDKGKEATSRYEILDIREEILKYENNENEKVSEELYITLKQAMEQAEKQIGRK